MTRTPDGNLRDAVGPRIVQCTPNSELPSRFDLYIEKIKRVSFTFIYHPRFRSPLSSFLVSALQHSKRPLVSTLNEIRLRPRYRAVYYNLYETKTGQLSNRGGFAAARYCDVTDIRDRRGACGSTSTVGIRERPPGYPRQQGTAYRSYGPYERDLGQYH